MADTQVTFDIVTRGADRSARDFRKVGGAADDTSHRFRRFTKITTRTAKVAGAALGGALVVLAGGLVSSAKAAAEEETEMAVLRNTLRKATKATDEQVKSAEDWVTKMQNATGVADGDLRPALGKLAIATGDISDAQKLLAQALDISVARGKPLNTVVEALSKAAQGNVTGLQRLGVQTKDTAGKTKSFTEILKDASDTMGGSAAAAADTAAGRYKILQARFQDLKEDIGAKLLPVLNRLLGFINDKLIPALGDFSDWFKEHVLPTLRKVAAYVRDVLIPNLADLSEQVLPAIKDAADSLSDSMRDLKVAFGLSQKGGHNFGGEMDGVKAIAAALRAEIKLVTVNVRIVAAAFKVATGNLRALAKIAERVLQLLAKVKSAASDLPGAGALGGLAQKGGDLLGKLPVPGFAEGGIVKARPGGLVARIGEGRYDEAVVPLKNGAGIGGLSLTQYVTTADPKRAADESVRGVRRAAWAAGWSVA